MLLPGDRCICISLIFTVVPLSSYNLALSLEYSVDVDVYSRHMKQVSTHRLIYN